MADGSEGPAGRDPADVAPVKTVNARGRSPFVLVCDHASNRVPPEYHDLGLSAIDRLRHIAWDPGALALSFALVDLLDAPLVYSTVSRLVVDCNRTYAAPDLIAPVSEGTEIPGNRHVAAADRKERIRRFHTPFHEALGAVLDDRAADGRESILIAVHSFTPVYGGVHRPWPIGLIHGVDTRYTRGVYDALRREAPDMLVGWNEPYAALAGVTYTLEHHGDGRGLTSTMIEVRHDEILDPPSVGRWARLLARCFEDARGA